MSIEVYIHTSIDVTSTQAIVDRLRVDHPKPFQDDFRLYDARASDDFMVENLKDRFDFDVVSESRVRLVNKGSTKLADTIRLIRGYFNEGEVLTLFENESIFPSSLATKKRPTTSGTTPVQPQD